MRTPWVAVPAIVLALTLPAAAASSVPRHTSEAAETPRLPVARPLMPPRPAPQSAPAPPTSAPQAANTVKAVVVKSWATCNGGGAVWSELNRRWPRYGTTPIWIDYSDPGLCGDSFTLDALEASDADVVILDNPAGGNKQYTRAEVSALSTYASEGHDLIGTFLTFSWGGGGTDNTLLAPLFGLAKGAGWKGGGTRVPTTYLLRIGRHRGVAQSLFRGLPNPFHSTGYHAAQTPGDTMWSSDDLRSARLMATNSPKSAGITLYLNDAYSAIYIANMPEYILSGSDDSQLLYNAIIFPKQR